MISKPAFVGARLVDSYPFSVGGTQEQANSLKSHGVDGVIGYLGVINVNRLNFILNAALAFMPVTVAGAYFNPPETTLSQIRNLQIPNGATVWLDLEGQKSFNTPPQELAGRINAWSKLMILNDYIPGLYIGSPQPFTGPELASLAVMRYWSAPSLILDRNGRDWSEPTGIGFCMRQFWDQGTFPGTNVFVDVNMVGKDRHGRLPTVVVA